MAFRGSFELYKTCVAKELRRMKQNFDLDPKYWPGDSLKDRYEDGFTPEQTAEYIQATEEALEAMDN